ncbi:hypothetical protein ELI15_14050 [Rhizobium ruizarguesonis]|uniref:nucleotidyl transferase AbiEii/AbiGii toxin family protein n=1 Tax=Rhizobium ruizarguesonis TaxID=2081791 RepID=UPI001030A84D|nr:nucleotidyl transferase AbiEii/AbiGii toxin family protein [Rhizobium ruizarguesonis]TAW65412.1 hypothetical protein ELI15_14050 [Rhizobium ruizarguesonis]
MANDATFDIGKRTIDRIKSASSVHEIDTRKSTERWLCEELSRGFTAVEPVFHLVKGGLLHAQITRETGDLDITFARKMSESEILRDIHQMAPLLAAKGIEIAKIGDMQNLIINGDGGMRFPITAMVGGTRINTHIDVTGGMRHLPAKIKDETGQVRKVQKSFGSVFFKGQQPLEAYYQPFEAQAADKLATVVLRPDTTRWKDFDDLSRLYQMGLSRTKIAVELAHKLSYMYKTARDVLLALPEVPAAMSFDYAREKAAHWQMWQQRNGRTTTTDFEAVACDSRNLYFDVRKVLVDSYQPVRKPKVERKPTVAEVKQAFGGSDSNIIQMGRYRDPGSLTFRPKF